MGFICVEKDDTRLFQSPPHGFHIIDGATARADRTFHPADRLQRQAR